jgi:hypothetical protein
MENIMNTPQRMYALNRSQTAALIHNTADTQSVLALGATGIGKTALFDEICKLNPDHGHSFFDGANKDMGDMALPDIKNSDEALTFVLNEELGLHLDKPVILCIDEYPKCNRSIKLMLNSIIHERKIGGRKLMEGSKVFMFGNLGAEGLGDLLEAHTCNRMTVVEMKKPDHMEWIAWGVNNGIDPTILGWVKDNPSVFADFRDVKNPDENQYIHHPQAVGRTAFCTPRSFHKLSNIFSKREHLDEHTLTSAAIGTIGAAAALDLMAFVKLANQLPSAESIKTDPDGATVPTSASAVCMVVYRTLASMDKTFVTPWLKYLNRLPIEAQGMFANGVMTDGYHAQKDVTTNAGWATWCVANTHLFAADKV